MSRTPPSAPAATPGEKPPHRQSRLGLVALILAVLALPAALSLVLGIIVAVIVLIVGLVALIRATRVREISTGQPVVAVVVAIAALILASVVTSAANDRVQDCGARTYDDARECLQGDN
ncbi:hypothetical protein [Corynebacterium nuruki]|uniref:hypothetical protein n=1 Tax=Corynebacterium nuruki TaxID=1032851 RepID=UPI0039BF2EA0